MYNVSTLPLPYSVVSSNLIQLLWKSVNAIKKLIRGKFLFVKLRWKNEKINSLFFIILVFCLIFLLLFFLFLFHVFVFKNKQDTFSVWCALERYSHHQRAFHPARHLIIIVTESVALFQWVRLALLRKVLVFVSNFQVSNPLPLLRFHLEIKRNFINNLPCTAPSLKHKSQR